ELKAERMLALTATATPSVVENICARFGIPKECAIVTGFYRPNLAIWTTPVRAEDRDAMLLDRLTRRESGTTNDYVTPQKTGGRAVAASTVAVLAAADDIPALDNFAYGGTATESSVLGLVEHFMSQPEEFDVSLYELSTRFDIRQLVLRTALTYMELLGFLHQRTPFYGSYKIKPLVSVNEIVGRFQGERARLVANIFAQAKEGRTWYTLDLGRAAETLSQERSRLVRAVEYLEQQGWVELQVADVRQQYSLVRRPQEVRELLSVLARRFERREQQEVARMAQVVGLVVEESCQTNALVR